MALKIVYTGIILVVCIIFCIRIKKKNNSMGFAIFTGLIAAIIGNIFIPSDISVFDIFDKVEKTGGDNIDNIVPKIELDSELLQLISTDEADLEVAIVPGDSIVNWASDNQNVAIVDNKGHLRAINGGTAIISATIVYDGLKYADSCNVVVRNPIISIDASASLDIGETKMLSVITIPEELDVIWNSDNKDIVVVDNSGEIKGIAEGTTTITATMTYNNESYSANCNITVKAPAGALDNIFEGNATNDKDESGKQDANNAEEPEPSNVSLADVAWLQDKKAYVSEALTTTRGETWYDCIQFGSSNLNADGNAYIIAACDQKYSTFSAEIVPQEGFDETESITLYIYGTSGNEQIFLEEYSIDCMSKAFEVEFDISNVDELYISKVGNYGADRIAGQYINGYTGMGILMRNAILSK